MAMAITHLVPISKRRLKMEPLTLIFIITGSILFMILGIIIVKAAINQEKEFARLIKGDVNYKYPKTGFFALLERCYELQNKTSRSRDRYVPCIAYTNAQTFGGAIKNSTKEYCSFKRAWMAITYAKVMAVVHDKFVLKKKDYGIIYYIEEK